MTQKRHSLRESCALAGFFFSVIGVLIGLAAIVPPDFGKPEKVTLIHHWIVTLSPSLITLGIFMVFLCSRKKNESSPWKVFLTVEVFAMVIMGGIFKLEVYGETDASHYRQVADKLKLYPSLTRDYAALFDDQKLERWEVKTILSRARSLDRQHESTMEEKNKRDRLEKERERALKSVQQIRQMDGSRNTDY